MNKLPLLLFWIFTNNAFADLKVYETNALVTKKQIASDIKPESEGFFENAEKYKIYGARFSLSNYSASDFKNKKIEVLQKTDGIDFVSNANETYVLIGASTGNIQLKTENGSVKNYIFEWTPLQKSSLTNKCGKLAPQFILAQPNSEKKEIPFLLATNCRSENKNLWITVSTLPNVEWLESSIFEAAGKAERWRDYQVPAWPPNGGVIAKLKMKFAGQIYDLNYVAPKSGDIKKKEELVKQQQQLSKQFENTLKISQTSLGLTADTASATDSKFSLGYEFLSPKLIDLFKFGGFFNSTLEIAKKDEALSYIEMLVHGDYVYSFDDQIDVSVGLAYQYADFQQKSTAARMQNSQIGLILGSQYLINTENRLALNIYKTTFSSKTITGNLAVILDYKYKLGDATTSNYWLGLFYKMQSFDAVNDTGASRKFKETQIGASLSF